MTYWEFNDDMEYVFKGRPRLNLFLNVYNFLTSEVSPREWAELHNLDVKVFEQAVKDCNYTDGKLFSQFIDWCAKSDEEYEIDTDEKLDIMSEICREIEREYYYLENDSPQIVKKLMVLVNQLKEL